MERTFRFGESVCTAQLSGNTSPVKALIDDRKIEWEFERVAEGEFLFRNAERQVRIFVAQDKAGSTFVQSEGRAYRLSPVDRDFEASAEEENGGKGGGCLIAAMPGRIIKVLVEPGQEVEKNQPVLVMESMKMEITQTSSFHGRVEEVNIETGQQVNAGSLMVRIEPISRE